MKRCLPAYKVQNCFCSPAEIYFPVSAFFKAVTVMFALFFSLQGSAQQNQQEQYLKVITERSAKIVNTLSITDSVKYRQVLQALVNQYAQLNNIHEQNKILVDTIKKQSLSADERSLLIKKEEEKKSAQLLQLHGSFIALLKENLTEGQIDQIKDGMTYHILPITYAAYQDMVLTLTSEQKAKIYEWLKEARELAMDEGSSDKKHAVFGKYKGRINNYLSAAGYNMKKEGEEWQKRIDAKKSTNQ